MVPSKPLSTPRAVDGRPPGASNAIRVDLSHHDIGTPRWRGPRQSSADAIASLVRAQRDRDEELLGRLHDGPLQLLIAAAQDMEEHLAGEVTDLVDTVFLLREAIAGLRAINVERFDAIVGDASLESTIRAAADRLQDDGGPAVSVTVGPGTSGPHDGLVATATAELLVNVGKHAQAGRASVMVHRDDTDRIVVIVSDDGVGVTEAGLERATSTGHTGLRLIEHRLGRIGGRLQCTRARPGTTTVLSLPPVEPTAAGR